MKTRILIMAIGLCLVVASSAQTVEISGKVSDEIKSVTLKAFNAKTLAYDEVDNVQTKNGKYLIKYSYDLSNLMVLDFSGKQSIKLSLTTEKSITVDFLSDKVTIKGSPESIAMRSFDEENGQMQAKFFGQLKKDANVAMASGDPVEMKKIQDRSAKAIQEFLVELRQWIIEKGEGPAGYQAMQFSDFNKELEFIDGRLKEFERQHPNSPVTKALARQVYRSKVVSIGKMPPAISALDRAGNRFDMDQYKGKVLLIDFWAAWCRACRIENPQFVTLHNEFNAQGFEVVSISQDETKEAWEKAIIKDGVDIWRHIWDQDEAITNLYSVSSLPQNVVLGRDGKIIGKNVNAEQLKELLATAL